MAWAGPEQKTVARFVVHYEGGQVGRARIEIPLTVTVNVADWWSPKRDLPEARVAWEKSHPLSGANVGLYMFEWKNPEAVGVIDRIDFEKTRDNDNTIPILVAITGVK